MLRIANAQLWVHDQDEALAFYTEKLGMEVRSDVTLPEMGEKRLPGAASPTGPPPRQQVRKVDAVARVELVEGRHGRELPIHRRHRHVTVYPWQQRHGIASGRRRHA